MIRDTTFKKKKKKSGKILKIFNPSIPIHYAHARQFAKLKTGQSLK